MIGRAENFGLRGVSLAGQGWRVKNGLHTVKLGRTTRFDLQMFDCRSEQHRERLPRGTHTIGRRRLQNVPAAIQDPAQTTPQPSLGRHQKSLNNSKILFQFILAFRSSIQTVASEGNVSGMLPALCGLGLRSVDLAACNAGLEAGVAVLALALPPEPHPA